jgi:hypothetical protein
MVLVEVLLVVQDLRVVPWLTRHPIHLQHLDSRIMAKLYLDQLWFHYLKESLLARHHVHLYDEL